jgi:uncharacterized protein YcnI
MKSIASKSASILAVTAGLFLLGTGVASGHVVVSAPGATQGGYSVLTFRVPTESDTASTVGVKVQLPTDEPLASVSVQPKDGWTYTVTKSTLATPITTDDGQVTEAISEIDWTATGGGIAPGEFDQFLISVGPLPDVPTMTFKAIQHYSDNTDVAWIEEPAAGSTAEPEHRAPTLTLAAAAADDSTTGTSTTGTSTTGTSTTAAPASSGVSVDSAAVTTTDPDAASKGSVTVAIVIGVIGVVVGAIGVGLALAARRRPAA